METDDALRAYYERGMERERLSDGRGDLEFTRTTEIVLRRLTHRCEADLGRCGRATLRFSRGMDAVSGTGASSDG